MIAALVPNIVSMTSSLDCSYSLHYLCLLMSKYKKKIIVIVIMKSVLTGVPQDYHRSDTGYRKYCVSIFLLMI